MDLTLDLLALRIPEIAAAAVRGRAALEPIWTAPAGPELAAAAPADPPAPDDPAWRPLARGERWGVAPGDAPDWEPPRLPWQIPLRGGSTHWLRAELRVPEAWRAHPVLLGMHWQGDGLDQVESIVALDGAVIGGLDWGHRSLMLPEAAHAGAHALLIRAAVAFPQPFGGLELQLRDPAIYRLGQTMRALLEVTQAQHADAPARAALHRLLSAAYAALDLREGYGGQAFAASAAAALGRLEADLRALPPDGLAPRVVATGHGHLDVAWLWPLWRTRQKVAHTVAVALELMERYPAYHFSMSQPQVYQYLKEDEPALYARVRQRVAEGRFEPVGIMWVEPDCNVTGGESLVRQMVRGARFYAQEFPERYGAAQAAPHVVWLPDAFGFTAALPQIMRGAGVGCFLTTKLSWNQVNRMPADTFRWRGIDGSEVLAHLLTTTEAPPRHPSEPQGFAYGGPLSGGALVGSWRHYQQRALNDELLFLYGYGDGGGGPSEEMLAGAQALADLPGAPRVRLGRADRYFADLYARLWPDERLPRWSGELYLEYHRGTLTSQAGVKQANRRAELAYRAAEWLNAWAAAAGGANRQAELERGWELILLNQFHDILPGSSIAAVYEQARADYAAAMRIADEVARAALGEVLGQGGLAAPPAPGAGAALLALNPLPWAREEAARVPLGAGPAPEWPDSQLVEERPGERELLVRAAAPAYGYAPLAPLPHAGRLSGEPGAAEQGRLAPPDSEVGRAHRAPQAPPPAAGGALLVRRAVLQSDALRIELDEHGEIAMLHDRRHDRRLARPGAPLNQLVCYEDRPLAWDAWDIDHFYAQKPYPARAILGWEVAEAGPLRAAVLITRRLGQSTIRQRICLWRDLARVDFVTEVDWRERQSLLRALFPLDLNAERATCEIQFGAIERPTHRNTSWEQARFEVCAQRWVDLSEGDYGVALLNDGKYGHSFEGGTIGLSLLKGGTFPDPDADVGLHRFTYSLLPHAGDWRAAQVVRRAYELNAPLQVIAAPAPQAARSFLAADCAHIVLETVKAADDGDGLIVRLYEAHNQRGAATLTFERPLLGAEETDLLERPGAPLAVEGRSLRLTLRPFEIKTVRARLG